MQNGMNAKLIRLANERQRQTHTQIVSDGVRGSDSDNMPIAIRHVKSNKSRNLIYLFAFYMHALASSLCCVLSVRCIFDCYAFAKFICFKSFRYILVSVCAHFNYIYCHFCSRLCVNMQMHCAKISIRFCTSNKRQRRFRV